MEQQSKENSNQSIIVNQNNDSENSGDAGIDEYENWGNEVLIDGQDTNE